MDEPLIYTKNGNVPEKSLRYEKEWLVGGEIIMFREFWYDAEGDLVKNNVHAYATKGLQIGAEQAVM